MSVRPDTWLNTSLLSARALGAFTAAALALGVTGCGGDDEEEPAATTQAPPARTAPEPVTTPPPETTPPEDPKEDPDTEPRTVPPEENAGDEEPIRSEAVFTGSGGRLGPRVVRVPPYIAVRVILRASDASRDQSYTLTIGGRRLALGHTANTAEANLDGLLPNRSYVGRSPQGNVRIEASAEPGP